MTYPFSRRSSIFAFILLCVLAACSIPLSKDRASSVEALRPTVLLVSIDGFRWDYMEKAPTPALHAIAAAGVRPKSLRPVFPSVTFTNHYSIVTGLFADHHGIVANTMWDPSTEKRFTIRDRAAVENSAWWGGEPFWVTAEKQGQIAATMFWVGSEAKIQGRQPTHWFRYDAEVPRRTRVEQVLKWLDLPAAQRPTFLSLYFEDVDKAGHKYGPESKQVREAIQAVDASLGELMAGLRERNIHDKINMLVVSDHGMAEVHPDRTINIDRYVDSKQHNYTGGGAFGGFHPSEENVEAVYRGLHNLHPHLHVYRRAEIPERFHYRAHRRVPSVFCLADEGWYITQNGRTGELDKGAHGYDNALPSMHGFFLASGPAFRVGATTPTIDNIHLYALMANLLQLRPAPNDGTLAATQGLLKTSP